MGALGRVESFIFTLDDPNFEDPTDIARQMQSYVTDPRRRRRRSSCPVRMPSPRPSPTPASMTTGSTSCWSSAKGDETRNIINGKPVPYEGDSVVVRRVLGE